MIPVSTARTIYSSESSVTPSVVCCSTAGIHGTGSCSLGTEDGTALSFISSTTLKLSRSVKTCRLRGFAGSCNLSAHLVPRRYLPYDSRWCQGLPRRIEIADAGQPSSLHRVFCQIPWVSDCNHRMIHENKIWSKTLRCVAVRCINLQDILYGEHEAFDGDVGSIFDHHHDTFDVSLG